MLTELINGVIGWCGTSFYKDVPEAGQGNMNWNGYPQELSVPSLTPGLVAKAKTNVKIVVLTGDQDSNLKPCTDDYAAMKKEHFQARYLKRPGLGHAVGSVEVMKQALDFILTPAAGEESAEPAP